MITIRELTKMVVETTGRDIEWELGKKYTAIDKNTGETVAIYNPRTGTLEVTI